MNLGCNKFLTFIILTVCIHANAQGPAIDSALIPPSRPFNEMIVDIPTHYHELSEKLSADEMQAENRALLLQLNTYIPLSESGRAHKVSVNDAIDLLNVMKSHPVIGWDNRLTYEKQTDQIGFCFGRASYAHLMLLKMGVQKESIYKIWAYGEMKVPATEIVWHFHVATVVFTSEYGWVVIDPNFHVPLLINEWTDHHMKFSTDGKLKFYLTPAEKFSISIGKYHPVQLGLKLKVEEDWYSHYFVDMLKSIRSAKLEELGLRQLSLKDADLISEAAVIQAQDAIVDLKPAVVP